MGPWEPDLGESGLGSLLRLQPRNSDSLNFCSGKGQIYQISHFSYFEKYEKWSMRNGAFEKSH